MIEYLILLWLIKYREGFASAEPEVDHANGPYAGLFLDDVPEPSARERPKLTVVK